MSSFSHATTGLRIGLAAAALYLIGGCARGEISETSGGPTAQELVSFYSPRSVKVLPFTKARSFDDDNFPDGIAVSLQPRDGAGRPGEGVWHLSLRTLRVSPRDRRSSRRAYPG